VLGHVQVRGDRDTPDSTVILRFDVCIGA
jgi:hypothetical protein